MHRFSHPFTRVVPAEPVNHAPGQFKRTLQDAFGPTQGSHECIVVPMPDPHRRREFEDFALAIVGVIAAVVIAVWCR